MANRPMEFWKMALEKTGNKEIDPRVKKAIMRVYEAYPADCTPNGVCDPMYIMNVIAMELGIGDGCGTFNLPEPK